MAHVQRLDAACHGNTAPCEPRFSGQPTAEPACTAADQVVELGQEEIGFASADANQNAEHGSGTITFDPASTVHVRRLAMQ